MMRADYAIWLMDGAAGLGRRAQAMAGRASSPAEPAVSEHTLPGGRRVIRLRNASPADLVAAMGGGK